MTRIKNTSFQTSLSLKEPARTTRTACYFISSTMVQIGEPSTEPGISSGWDFVRCKSPKKRPGNKEMGTHLD